jgi:hypothetical protein
VDPELEATRAELLFALKTIPGINSPTIINAVDGIIVGSGTKVSLQGGGFMDSKWQLTPLSFKTDNFKVYGVEEIEEAKLFLMNLRQYQ